MATGVTRGCALVGLPLLVASCTVGPNYTRPVIEAPAAYRGADPDPGPDALSLADQQWSATFQDDALRDLIQRAVDYGYDVRVA